MKYFKVVPAGDQRTIKGKTILVANELYTQKEVNKYKIPLAYIFEVDIKPKETYFFFGARFSKH